MLITLIIVLPAYNEAGNLEPLVQSISQVLMTGAYRIVVVDDGSSDNTPEILDRLSTSTPIRVVTHDTNRGLGRTILDGLRHALELATPDSIIVTMDADQTHPVSVIPKLMQAIEGKGCDVAIASRYRKGSQVNGLSCFRKTLSYGASLLFRSVLPVAGVRDYTCGYRAYRASALRLAMQSYGDDLIGGSGFECMAGILLKCRTMGFRFVEVPFTLHYDRKRGASKMRVGRTIIATIRLALTTRARGFADRLPLGQGPVPGRDS